MPYRPRFEAEERLSAPSVRGLTHPPTEADSPKSSKPLVGNGRTVEGEPPYVVTASKRS